MIRTAAKTHVSGWRTSALAVFARNHAPFLGLAIILGGLHAWAAISKHSMNADGISYLDIGDAFFRTDWELAINPVWPPLYAWLLGLVNALFRPSMAWEFPAVHILNFVIYLAALGSFIYLWHGLRKSVICKIDGEWLSMPDWHWWALGYTLFIWTSLSLIQIWAVTPDMLTAVFLYLSAGLIVRMRITNPGWGAYAVLGVLLGLGYLAKAFMFSMAFIFLALSLLTAPVTKKTLLKTGLAFCVFIAVSLPFILLISQKAGKLTIGESGTVTYLRYVGGIPFPHWQGDLERGIVPTHPSRLLLDDPPVYEFGEPIGGTYPISTDPSYWYAGIETPFNLGSQIARIVDGGIYYLDLFIIRHGFFTACILLLVILAIQQRTISIAQWRNWLLILPAAAGFGLYALVLVADRYIGIFVLLFWSVVLANIRLPANRTNESLIKILSTTAVLGLLAVILLFNLEGMGRLNPAPGPATTIQAAPPDWPGVVAQELQQYGIQPLDQVAVIGYAYDSFWARLARVTIVAEMLAEDADEFWVGDEAMQSRVVQAFARSGAKAIVAEYVPSYAQLNGWHQVEDSNYYIYLFNK
jgi:hypothetical protein